MKKLTGRVIAVHCAGQSKYRVVIVHPVHMYGRILNGKATIYLDYIPQMNSTVSGVVYA